MSWFDFILNLVGLLLWLGWRAIPWQPPVAAGASLAFTVKPAGPPRPRWAYLAAIVAMVFLRALFYWEGGPPLRWMPQIPLGPMILSFRSDLFSRMLLFSCLSFAATLGIFYACLLALSWINAAGSNSDPAHRLVRLHLGSIDRWPGVAKLLLPLLVMLLAWCALHPLLTALRMAPRAGSPVQLVEEGAVAGLAAYLPLKFFLVALLALYVVNSYVFLGDFAFWTFVNNTGSRLLRPLQPLPLRIGRVDFAPALAIALILIASELGRRELARLYLKIL